MRKQNACRSGGSMEEFIVLFMKLSIAFAIIVGILLLGIAAFLFLHPAAVGEVIRVGIAFLCLVSGIWIIGSLLVGIFQK